MNDDKDKIMESLQDYLINGHPRNLSALLYFVAGVLLFLSVFSLIAPFCCSLKFLDEVLWKENLKSQNVVAWVPLVCIILSIIYKKTCYSVTEKITGTDLKSKKRVTQLYTIEVLLEFVSAMANCLFSISVFLHVYHSGEILLSLNALLIYFWITYNFTMLIYTFFAKKIKKIVDEVFEKYENDSE